jgi:hypothetical protein
MPKITTGPAPLDWETYSGDANLEIFEVVTESDPVDITGAEIAAQARVSASDPAVALEAVTEVVEPLLGRFTVAWPGEEVRALLGVEERWTGVWDLQFTAAGEPLPRTLLRGVFTAVADVTRDEVVGP